MHLCPFCNRRTITFLDDDADADDDDDDDDDDDERGNSEKSGRTVLF